MANEETAPVLVDLKVRSKMETGLMSKPKLAQENRKSRRLIRVDSNFNSKQTIEKIPRAVTAKHRNRTIRNQTSVATVRKFSPQRSVPELAQTIEKDPSIERIENVRVQSIGRSSNASNSPKISATVHEFNEAVKEDVRRIMHYNKYA